MLVEEEKATKLIEEEIEQLTEASKKVENLEEIRQRLKEEVQENYDIGDEDTVDCTVKEDDEEMHYTTFLDQFSLPMFKCDHCELTYSQKYSMKKHIKTHTRQSEEQSKPFVCDECEKPFNKPNLLRFHKERVHEKLKRHSCFVCQKGFFDRHQMLEHLQIHDDARKSEERFLSEEFFDKLNKGGQVMLEGRKITTDQVCQHCAKVFQIKESKLRHEKNHFNEKKHAKAMALSMLGNDTRPKAEKAVKLEKIKMEQIYSCTLDCNKSYYSEIDLATHMERADHEGGFFFTCAKCPKKFASTKTMKNHICDQTTGYAPLTVEDIEASQQKTVTKTKSTIQPPQKQAFSETKPKIENVSSNLYNCKECGQNLPSESSLDIHIKIHREMNSVNICKSNNCNESFPTKKKYWAHKLSAHNEKRTEDVRTRVKCKMCEKICRSKHDLKGHMQKHNTDKNYVCQECGKEMKRRESLKYHMLAHKGILSVHCDECGDMFVSTVAMLSHKMNKHYTEGIYMCPTCNRDCHNKHKLKRHMVGHTDIRPFPCRAGGGCERAFQTTQVRNTHEKWHTGVKDYPCTKCPKEFMQPQQLSVHMKRHNNIRDHKCLTCGRLFIEPAGARHCKHTNLGIAVFETD